MLAWFDYMHHATNLHIIYSLHLKISVIKLRHLFLDGWSNKNINTIITTGVANAREHHKPHQQMTKEKPPMRQTNKQTNKHAKP
jgi:hypothetical protein